MIEPLRGLVTLGETMGLLSATEIGPLRHCSTMSISMAGSESNVSIGVRRLGVPAEWIGRIGPDEFGEIILRELRAEGVVAHAVVDEAPTGLMLKERRISGLTRVSYYRTHSAGSRLCPSDIQEAAVAGAGVLHVTGLTLALGTQPAAAVRTALDIAEGAHVPISFDVNYRAALWTANAARPVLRSLLGSVDIVFAGAQEAQLLVDATEPTDLARGIAKLGPSQVVIMRGSAGATALIDGELHDVPAIPVDCVDPVGAGDAFVAGYLSQLLKGSPPNRRLDTAARAGAFAVSAIGDWQGLPRYDELGLLGADDRVLR